MVVAVMVSGPRVINQGREVKWEDEREERERKGRRGRIEEKKDKRR